MVSTTFDHVLDLFCDIDWTVDLSASELVEQALFTREARLGRGGPLVVETGAFTGRSPDDRFIVHDSITQGTVDWGRVNRPMEPSAFDALARDMAAWSRGRRLHRQTLAAGADRSMRTPVTVVTERAWHALFAYNLFLRDRTSGHGWTVVDLPSFRADPARHGSRSSTVVALDLSRRTVLIAGTEYGGEIKKSIFSAVNFELPGHGVLPMHCSANASTKGNVALFFGLSGTGKTTLSADPERILLGDDEHAWSDAGVSNVEGGCYAKVIGLRREAEPDIHAASTRFGTVLENVTVRADRSLDFASDALTENTRAAYPLSFVPRASQTGTAPHPSTIVFLTADAFGVLPPLARLTRDEAMVHFLSGYTAKVAGTERGIVHPVATFSACFGAPFLPRPPDVYASMLADKIDRHRVSTWLVNTGWTGGPPGTGRRIPLQATRAMISAIVEGTLDGVPCTRDRAFSLSVPHAVPGVAPELLRPRSTWADPEAYDRSAASLRSAFWDNFTSLLPHAPQRWLEALPKTVVHSSP